MPAYKFEALDAAGKATTGLLEADNAKAARAQLRAQALVPLEVSQVAASGTQPTGLRYVRRVFNSTGLTVWTRQLAGLVGSGLPLERALTALADEAEDNRQRELVAHLRSEVNAGSPFARALAGAPREFDDVYRGVVAAGEASGALGPVLERLADDLEERQALRAKLIGATLYPAIVSLIAVVIVVFLVTYVVPQVASVFTSSKRALPALTVAMLAISAFLRNWGWLLLLGIAGGVGTLLFMLRNEAFVAERLDIQLDDAMRRFLSDRTRNRFDTGTGILSVSKIFDWYHKDFERGHKGYDSLQTLFARHAVVLGATPQAQAEIRAGRYKLAFLDYDWALNDAR